MDQLEVEEYLDEKSAFYALVKEHENERDIIREKDNKYRQNYIKSFLHRAEFNTNTLINFKQTVMNLNKNKNDVVEKSEFVKK